MASLFGEVPTAERNIVGLTGSGSSAKVNDMHNAAVDGEERRRALHDVHPTGAGVSAQRDKSLLMVLLVPAYGTSRANPRLPRRPWPDHHSGHLHQTSQTQLSACQCSWSPTPDLFTAAFRPTCMPYFSTPAVAQLALADSQTPGSTPLP